MASPPAAPLIVVGADGSPSSVRAVRWAAGRARGCGGVLRVVTGYQVPASILVAPTRTEADYTADARRRLDRSVAEALGPAPAVAIQKQVVRDAPARALVEAARDARLLVVGAHGRGELFGLLHLAPVASYVVRHAPCPVAVVRDDTTAPVPGTAAAVGA